MVWTECLMGLQCLSELCVFITDLLVPFPVKAMKINNICGS